MSKKEIRRASRDAFPKSKRARTSGTSGKSTGGTTPNRNVPKPPSVTRSFIFGVIAAVFYFVLIQWIMKLSNSTTANLVIAVIGLFLFTGVNYVSEVIRYRRYIRKNQGSDQ